MKTRNEIDPVEVFAGTTWQAEMVKSLLGDSGIQAYIKDEVIGTLSPWWTAPGGAGAVKVIVSNADVDAAKPIVAAYEENLKTNL
jgi:hypothetical protein